MSVLNCFLFVGGKVVERGNERKMIIHTGVVCMVLGLINLLEIF